MEATDPFAKMTAMLAANQPHPVFVVGHEFITDTVFPWSEADRTRHHQKFTLRCRVTGTKPNGFDYEVVEVLAEEDAPPASIRRGAPDRGSMAWFAIDPLTAEGTLRAVA